MWVLKIWLHFFFFIVEKNPTLLHSETWFVLLRGQRILMKTTITSGRGWGGQNGLIYKTRPRSQHFWKTSVQERQAHLSLRWLGPEVSVAVRACSGPHLCPMQSVPDESFLSVGKVITIYENLKIILKSKHRCQLSLMHPPKKWFKVPDSPGDLSGSVG